MFARRVHVHLKSNRIVQLTEKLETEIIPILRKLKGIHDEIAFGTQSGVANSTFHKIVSAGLV